MSWCKNRQAGSSTGAGSRSSHQQHCFHHVRASHRLPPECTEWMPTYLRTIKVASDFLSTLFLTSCDSLESSNLPVCLRWRLRPGEYKGHSGSSLVSGCRASPFYPAFSNLVHNALQESLFLGTHSGDCLGLLRTQDPWCLPVTAPQGSE